MDRMFRLSDARYKGASDREIENMFPDVWVWTDKYGKMLHSKTIVEKEFNGNGGQNPICFVYYKSKEITDVRSKADRESGKHQDVIDYFVNDLGYTYKKDIFVSDSYLPKPADYVVMIGNTEACFCDTKEEADYWADGYKEKGYEEVKVEKVADSRIKDDEISDSRRIKDSAYDLMQLNEELRNYIDGRNCYLSSSDLIDELEMSQGEIIDTLDSITGANMALYDTIEDMIKEYSDEKEYGDWTDWCYYFRDAVNYCRNIHEYIDECLDTNRSSVQDYQYLIEDIESALDEFWPEVR